MKLENIAVVLVHPQGPVNVGSVCRAMMNFGFSDLRLVNPCMEFQKIPDARKMALGAVSLLEQAPCYTNLKSAIEDCNIAFGTTRRIGKYRKGLLIPGKAGDTIAELKNHIKCALVLGREDNGLTSEELELCQYFVTIPTDNAFASMNLSHALCILAYEISKAVQKKSLCQTVEGMEQKASGNVPVCLPGHVPTAVTLNEPHDTPADISEIEQMYEHMKKTLYNIDFLNPQNPEHILRTFRRMFGRAGLSSRDVRIIRGLMSRIDWVKAR